MYICKQRKQRAARAETWKRIIHHGIRQHLGPTVESRSASWPGVDQVYDVCEAEEGVASSLIDCAWVQAEDGRVQTGGGVTEVRFFYP